MVVDCKYQLHTLYVLLKIFQYLWVTIWWTPTYLPTYMILYCCNNVTYSYFSLSHDWMSFFPGFRCWNSLLLNFTPCPQSMLAFQWSSLLRHVLDAVVTCFVHTLWTTPFIWTEWENSNPFTRQEVGRSGRSSMQHSGVDMTDFNVWGKKKCIYKILFSLSITSSLILMQQYTWQHP